MFYTVHYLYIFLSGFVKPKCFSQYINFVPRKHCYKNLDINAVLFSYRNFPWWINFAVWFSYLNYLETTPVIYAVDILNHRPWYCCYLTADFVYYWHVALLLTVKHAYIQYIGFIFEHCNSSIGMSWNTAANI